MLFKKLAKCKISCIFLRVSNQKYTCIHNTQDDTEIIFDPIEPLTSIKYAPTRDFEGLDIIYPKDSARHILFDLPEDRSLSYVIPIFEHDQLLGALCMIGIKNHDNYIQEKINPIFSYNSVNIE